MASDDFRPLIIIGAPRSGTNVLRDTLTGFPDAASWPCDEINYIWRHGNVRYRSDEFVAEMATGKIQRYVEKQFRWVAKTYGAKTVVEKTCANSLRVPFVQAVLPGAKYIFIYRDGIDATGSAQLRWTSKLDIAYIFEKARFVPLQDTPYYATRYLWSRLYRMFSKDQRLAFWGPRLEDMDNILKHHSLIEVCALQWQRCVEKAGTALADVPAEYVHRVRYEDFVREPRFEIERMLEFAQIPGSKAQIEQAASRVSSNSIGKGRAALDHEQIIGLEALIGDTLNRYGYRS